MEMSQRMDRKENSLPWVRGRYLDEKSNKTQIEWPQNRVFSLVVRSATLLEEWKYLSFQGVVRAKVSAVPSSSVELG